MRALAAVGFLLLLITLGWNQSFESHWQQVTGQPITGPAKRALRTGSAAPSYSYGSAQSTAPVATPQDRSWIFKPTILDPPKRH
jgi:hypothetical protein